MAPMFWSDMGGGVFDGAHLVMNFEQLNPFRSLTATDRDRVIHEQTLVVTFDPERARTAGMPVREMAAE